MKPEEKSFLLFVAGQASFQAFKTVWLPNLIAWYSETFGIPIKRLWYWVEKWSRRGVVDYGTSLNGVWFNTVPYMQGEYKKIFESLFQLIAEEKRVFNFNGLATTNNYFERIDGNG